MKEAMLKEREKPGREVFREAQAKVYALMHRDSFFRWVLVRSLHTIHFTKM